MGHGAVVLALPRPSPLEAVSFFGVFTVDVQWAALATPLLEPSLALSVGGSAAAETGLCFSVMLDAMLAEPVPICAFFAGQVDRSVGSQSLLAAGRRAPMQPGECAVLLVSRDEESLPVVDLVQSPMIQSEKSWILRVEGEALGRCLIRASV